MKDGVKIRYKLEPDPESSVAVQVIRRMFDMALKDSGCKEIAKALNREGIRTGNGQLWGRTTVHKVLTNEAYCGTLVWGGRPGHPAIHSGDPPVRVEHAWAAIIDKDAFSQVRIKMASKRPAVIHPRTIPSSYLLSGLLYCSCGHSMIGRSAKSHHYHYYTCNGGYKQGRDACDARALPKDRLEHLVIDQIKCKVLNREWLEELLRLVNEELDSTHGILRDRLPTIDAELNDVKNRLSKLYDALETGKLSLDDLASRIKELRTRQDELHKARLQLEAEMAAHGATHIDAETVKSYAEDLKNLLGEADITESKSFLRSFIKRIEIDKSEAVIHYNLPVPLYRSDMQSAVVLPIDNHGGPKGTRTKLESNINDRWLIVVVKPG